LSLSALAARPLAPAHKQCSTCWLLGILEEPHRANLIAALSNPSVRYDEISTALEELGHEIPGPYLSRHARGGCDAKVKMRESSK